MSAKKQLEFTRRAIRKIAEAEEYIAQDNPHAAMKVAQYIYDAAENLESFPLLGRIGKSAGVRELVLDRYHYSIFLSFNHC
jgi:plasmid stabilization system protein ParE